jgi:hypothetical protein
MKLFKQYLIENNNLLKHIGVPQYVKVDELSEAPGDHHEMEAHERLTDKMDEDHADDLFDIKRTIAAGDFADAVRAFHQMLHTRYHNIKIDNAIYQMKKPENKHLRDQYVYHPESAVRQELAKHGDDSHRDQLVKDEDHLVRYAVAEHGNDQHRDQLINDPNSNIRSAVAQYGNIRHKLILSKDKNEYVRKAARK